MQSRLMLVPSGRTQVPLVPRTPTGGTGEDGASGEALDGLGRSERGPGSGLPRPRGRLQVGPPVLKGGWERGEGRNNTLSYFFVIGKDLCAGASHQL